MCHKCKYCNKEVKYDKKHKRYPTFCNKHCLELYNKEKYLREKDNHKCSICGKEAFFVEKYNRWLKTCGSSECKRESNRRAQQKGVTNRIKFKISKEELEDLYINQNKTRKEIATILGCSEMKVKVFIAKYHLSKDYSLRMIRVADTKFKKYGNAHFVNHEKARKTNLQKYGVSTNLLLLDNNKMQSKISKSETLWLDDLNIKIRQYRIQINDCYLFADGYDEKTNTIYEFFGDYWHCNPLKYKADYYNQRTYKTAKETWERDKQYFNTLRKLGYNIKFVWESDYKYKNLLFSEFNDYLMPE